MFGSLPPLRSALSAAWVGPIAAPYLHYGRPMRRMGRSEKGLPLPPSDMDASAFVFSRKLRQLSVLPPPLFSAQLRRRCFLLSTAAAVNFCSFSAAAAFVWCSNCARMQI